MEEVHTTRGAFVSLEMLHLENLKNLLKICHGRLAESCFGKLRDIQVGNCGNMKNLFPFFVAKGLLQLVKIEVSNCKMMEEIIIYEGEGDSQNMGDETIGNIQLPRLRILKLYYLPKLIEFYSPTKTNCRNIPRKSIQLVSNSATTLFNKKATFPKLRNLTITKNPTVNELWHGESEGLFSSLRKLVVSQLPNLIHLWDENHRHRNGSASLNLEALLVAKCNRLKTLAPSWVSFQNLMFLRVSRCPEMVNLLTPSTAKSLAKLRVMSISGCKNMTQVFADNGREMEGRHDDYQIVLDQLEVLEFRSLTSLTSFYSGKLTMSFPKLKYVAIGGCHELRSFSHGVVSTPQLHKIVLLDHESDDDNDNYEEFSVSEIHWSDFDKVMNFGDSNVGYKHCPVEEFMEGDINSTISLLWERNQMNRSDSDSGEDA